MFYFMFKPRNLSRGKGEREILIALQKVCYYYECKNFSEKKKGNYYYLVG